MPSQQATEGVVGSSTLFEILALHARSQYAYVFDFYRMLNLDDMVALTRDVEGSIVECGTGRGMTLAMLILFSRAQGLERRFWSFDSFEGLPEPSSEDLSSPRSLARRGDLKFGLPLVLDTLRAIGITEKEIGHQVRLVKGYFDATLSTYDQSPIALIHADADLYSSTKCVLEHLWPRLSVGGVVVFDEYDNTAEWPGEKLAADEYFAQLPRGSVSLNRDRFGLRYFAVRLF